MLEAEKEKKTDEFRTEKEVREYIDAVYRQKGSRYGLDNIRLLLRRLGNPQQKLRFVHIAGTNGKGSVLAYVSAVLRAAGYKTGSYSSPAVFSYRERMQVNGRAVSVRELCLCMESVRQASEALQAEGVSPTAFEQETAAAFVWFCRQQCDIVVLETGMGGLTDATNIVERTAVAVLTSISPDHMEVLGNSLSEIAEQKAGIIKNGCYVISAPQKAEVKAVIERTCGERQASLAFVDTAQLGQVRYGIERQSFSYRNYRKLEISMAGVCQIENAAVALETVEALRQAGFAVTDAALRRGLLQARWPGRFFVVGRQPLMIADGAHNPDAAARLADSLRFYFTNRKIVYIMGMLRDKQYGEVIRLTCALAAHIITVTPPENARALYAYELAQAAAAYHGSVTAADSLEEAVEMARLLAGKNGVVVAFGSLSYLGGLVRILDRQKTESSRTK